jgi:branched-chain amino acid transport system ATP-binding protein
MLNVTRLDAGYGAAQVLFGLSFSIQPGETLALMGRNGMGKTTTIRAVMGLLRPSAGTVRFDGIELTGTRPFRAARAGVGLVPEGRQVFPTLSVEENLLATAANRGPWTLERVYGLFPRLLERRRHRGLHLSGGEQQMLAIGRALMTNPRLLVLDEATEGLAPLVRNEIYTCLGTLKQQGLSILLIDKHLASVTRLADRVAVLEKGRIAWEGAMAALVADPALVDRHLHM